VFDDRDLARLVRNALEQRRISQRQLAHRSGVRHSTISRLLRGKRRPTHQTAARLTRVLGESPLYPAGLAAFLRRDPELDEHAIAQIVDLYAKIRRQP
jgi:transcriptional regulator with XRE-family HTH domain